LPLLRRRLTFSRKGVSVQVGKRKLEISTPDDLDDKLIELTGHSAKEVRALLDSWSTYKGVTAERIADLIYEAGPAFVMARLTPMLVGAMVGGYTASGEVKAVTK
jgi:hypothetical protein